MVCASLILETPKVCAPLHSILTVALPFGSPVDLSYANLSRFMSEPTGSSTVKVHMDLPLMISLTRRCRHGDLTTMWVARNLICPSWSTFIASNTTERTFLTLAKYLEKSSVMYERWRCDGSRCLRDRQSLRINRK